LASYRDGFTFLHSGKFLLNNGTVAARKEEVGIVLDARATEAWRQGEETVNAVSSRVVMARLKWVGSRQRNSTGGGGRVKSDVYVTIICA